MKYTNRVLGLLLALLLAFGTAAGASASMQAPAGVAQLAAAPAAVAKQTTANLNLRKSPSVHSASLLVIPKGAKVLVSGGSSGWVQATYKKKSGWVSAKYLTSPAAPAKPKSSATRYLLSFQPVRKKATSVSPALAGAMRKAKVQRLGATGSWSRIKIGKVTGFVPTSQLSSSLPAPVHRYSKSAQVLRKSTSAKAARVASVPAGAKVEWLRTSGSWSYVVTAGKRGWLPAKQLSTQPVATQKTIGNRWLLSSSVLRRSNHSSSASLGRLAPGEKVGLYTTRGSWSQIKSTRGIGWVPTAILSSTAYKPADPAPRWILSSTAVRASASGTSRSFGTVAAGSTLTLHGTSNGWARVKTSKTTGWVPSSALVAKAYTPLKAAKRWTTSNVHLRSGYSTGYKSLAVISKGQQVSLLGTANGWARVSTTKGTGWISNGYLATSKPQAPRPAPAPTTEYRWTTANVNLRAGSGVSHRSKAVLPAGQKVTFMRSDAGWAEVSAPQGRGWVRETYLSKSQPGVLQPDAQRVIAALKGRTGDTVSAIHTIRSGSSGHSSGKAVDLMIRDYKNRARVAQGDKLAQFLLDNRIQLGIYYLIWQDRIWLPTTGWTPYSDSGKYGNQFTGNWNDTTRHMDHIHVEVYGNAATKGPLDYRALSAR